MLSAFEGLSREARRGILLAYREPEDPDRISLNGLRSLVATLHVLWQECCQSPEVFCYHIGCSLFASLSASTLLRERLRLWSPSLSTFYTRSTTSKD